MHIYCVEGGEWRSVEIVRTYETVYEKKFFDFLRLKFFCAKGQKTFISSFFSETYYIYCMRY